MDIKYKLLSRPCQVLQTIIRHLIVTKMKKVHYMLLSEVFWLLGRTYAWGGLGHITTALIASHFVSKPTRDYMQGLLGDSTDNYLADIATWADSIKYTDWGRFSKPYHFIDAKDKPPESCNVDFERDCKADGCVVSSLANYTKQLILSGSPSERANATKFVVHLVGDIHQPLHVEDVAYGGNGIPVSWNGRMLNLHHVWDSSIAERWALRELGSKQWQADRWAQHLIHDISYGQYAPIKDMWLQDIDVFDPISTLLNWAEETNAFVCSTGRSRNRSIVTSSGRD
jgi:hypothetical protein